MLIVLTSEQNITNEGQLINQLFEEGLPVLHLRKPSFNIDEYRSLLKEIDSKYYQQIVIHEYHELCKEFDLKGIHIQEQPRIDLGDSLQTYVDGFQKTGFYKNYTVSSSFHEPEVLQACEINFDYYLLSPVFSSISKQGYEGRGFDVQHIKKTIVGMGGINASTIADAFQLGYKGVGVLGGVWNTKSPVESFKKLKQSYDQYLMK